MAVARVVEMVGVGAYLGAAALITDPQLLTAAASILTVEARHQTILNILAGSSTAIPAAFDLPLRPEQVLAIASPFISGCDLGITPNMGLTVTNQGAIKVGTSLTFDLSKAQGLDASVRSTSDSYSIVASDRFYHRKQAVKCYFLVHLSQSFSP
jgi:hypothetical protein